MSISPLGYDFGWRHITVLHERLTMVGRNKRVVALAKTRVSGVRAEGVLPIIWLW